MRTIGIIPIKSKSTRFPGKNFSDFNGKTLIVNTLEKMLKHIDTVFISTDDPISVTDMLKIYGYTTKEKFDLTDDIESGIYVLFRDEKLCQPDTPTDDVIHDLIKKLSFFDEDYIIALCQVTSPLWKPHTLRYAIHRHECYKYEKTIISVSPDYKPNGCFYIFTKSKFLKYQQIYAPDLYLVVFDWKQCADIDYAYQLFIAEAIARGDYDD